MFTNIWLSSIGLIDLCKTANLVIVNGRMTNDSSSNTTFRNISTIDYCLCCPLLFKYINNFIVHEHNPLFSDGHSALELSINTPLIVEVGVQNCNNPIVSRQHVKWEHNKITEFQCALKVVVAYWKVKTPCHAHGECIN